MSQAGKQIITIHILPNISGSKGNQGMKSGQLILIAFPSEILANMCIVIFVFPSVTSQFFINKPFC